MHSCLVKAHFDHSLIKLTSSVHIHHADCTSHCCSFIL